MVSSRASAVTAIRWVSCSHQIVVVCATETVTQSKPTSFSGNAALVSPCLHYRNYEIKDKADKDGTALNGIKIIRIFTKFRQIVGEFYYRMSLKMRQFFEYHAR
jgi:hypothetical protein